MRSVHLAPIWWESNIEELNNIWDVNQCCQFGDFDKMMLRKMVFNMTESPLGNLINFVLTRLTMFLLIVIEKTLQNVLDFMVYI